MREGIEILSAAAELKTKMVKRVQRLRMISANLADAAGKMVDVGVERLETMENEFKILEQRQELDAQRYATLRWALGVTEEIDSNNLELSL